MPTTALSQDELESIGLIDLDFEPDHQPKPVQKGPWTPDLNPSQRLMWDDASPYILAYGEKASGKTIGALKKLVRHCYENEDAFALIVSPSIRTGKFGLIHDLETLILPEWTEGIGLEWLPARLDPNTKDRLMKVANLHGGWSTILQISIPYKEAIESRVKAINPSFVLADELTDCEGEEYFSVVAAQLGRRRKITGPQQYVGTCNPKGPSNWVYKTFIELPTNPDTGVRDPAFSVYHIPFTENAHRPELAGYIAKMEALCRANPVKRARLIEGRWIEEQLGDSILHGFYIPDRHSVGSLADGTGLVPQPGFIASIGYDLGQVYSSAVFLQLVTVQDRPLWLVFDEIVHLREKILYKNLAKEVCERILEWNGAVKGGLAWEHIADDSATTQWRPGEGSYDNMEFEREFMRFALTHNLPPMTMVGCPKGAGSVEMRVQLMRKLLHDDQFLASATCTEVGEVLMMLQGTEDYPLRPKKDARGLIHTWDAMTYPILKHHLLGYRASGAAVSAVHAIK